MKYVAFLRNVNLGQPKSPTRLQLESAFIAAGAESVQSFQTNGTLIFMANNEHSAGRITSRALETLKSICGLEQPAYVVSLQHLADLVNSDPFADIQPPDAYQFSASFMPPALIAQLQVPSASPLGDVMIVRATNHVVLSATRKSLVNPGDARPLFVRLYAAPVTTRSWNTILRLVKKHAATSRKHRDSHR
jgi:uncharacterized protein (DUF1697 family)